MECTHCHRELKYDWNFCPDCGQLVRENGLFSLKQHEEEFEIEDRDDYPMDFNPQLYEW